MTRYTHAERIARNTYTPKCVCCGVFVRAANIHMWAVGEYGSPPFEDETRCGGCARCPYTSGCTKRSRGKK